jgi:divinyl chlorophyllide a 8-vinyl-reductase
MRIFMLGATGTIGQATRQEMQRRGHDVVCFGRSHSTSNATHRVGDVTDATSIERDGFCGEKFDAVVSCMASRNGLPRDAWAIDHRAHSLVLQAAQKHGVKHFVLLSAICVQKPKLAFQQAKLAFESELKASGLTYSIVRPTAFFKSLSGQVARVKSGKPFLVFGDGRLTSCKPISDNDLACFLANCLEQPHLQNATLPIGGPGPAMTPRQQGEQLFQLLGKPPRFRQMPVALLDGIITMLSTLGHVFPRLADKAELARIGRYYATESMLVLNPTTNQYDAEATPSFGNDTLQEFHAKLIRGETTVALGEHAVF